jgi:hypothetical protein
MERHRLKSTSSRQETRKAGLAFAAVGFIPRINHCHRYSPSIEIDVFQAGNPPAGLTFATG